MSGDTTGTGLIESKILSNAAAAGVDMRPLIEQIPEADEDAWTGILRSLLAAETVADLDAPWTARGLEQFVDVTIRVVDLKRIPSDFADGLGVYLVMDCVVDNEGQKATVTTGSVSVCAQLIRAYNLGALPLLVIPRQSKRPTANGYRPMHLEIVK